MIKTITIVGNSKAVILPAKWVKKFNVDEVRLEETEEGILIKAVEQKSNFRNAIDRLRMNRTRVYKRIELQANHPDTKKYYAKNTI